MTGPRKSEMERPVGPGNVDSRRLRIDEDGQLVIPADMRAAMLVDKTGLLTARVIDGELRVLSPNAAVASLQKMVSETRPQGISMVDELIAERRAEERRETDG